MRNASHGGVSSSRLCASLKNGKTCSIGCGSSTRARRTNRPPRRWTTVMSAIEQVRECVLETIEARRESDLPQAGAGDAAAREELGRESTEHHAQPEGRRGDERRPSECRAEGAREVDLTDGVGRDEVDRPLRRRDEQVLDRADEVVEVDPRPPLTAPAETAARTQERGAAERLERTTAAAEQIG